MLTFIKETGRQVKDYNGTSTCYLNLVICTIVLYCGIGRQIKNLSICKRKEITLIIIYRVSSIEATDEASMFSLNEMDKNMKQVQFTFIYLIICKVFKFKTKPY